MKLNSIQKKLYYNFLLSRTVQLEIISRYHPDDKMKCPMHFCTGQELMPAILGVYLKKNDSVYSHHRSHAYFLSKSGSLKKMIAEFHGKSSGTNGGLAGSQELSDPSINFYSGTILSGALAMGVGDAFAKKYKNQKLINVSVIGDGAMEEGIVYESINLAALEKLPALFICENNKYSTHTHIKDRVANTNISMKIKPFGVKCHQLHTNDPLSLLKKMKLIIDDTRNGNPNFVEVFTYRFGSHVGPEEDDHYNYRSNLERKTWEKNDPLNKLRKQLSKYNNFNNFNQNLEKKIMKLINEAFNFAEKSSFPKEYKKFNISNKYIKIKKFFNNQIEFGSNQEGHKPKPY